MGSAAGQKKAQQRQQHKISVSHFRNTSHSERISALIVAVSRRKGKKKYGFAVLRSNSNHHIFREIVRLRSRWNHSLHELSMGYEKDIFSSFVYEFELLQNHSFFVILLHFVSQ
jgi:hypothetical protein